ncbi:hypothetical protein LCGC14_0643350 [marine sediment metagenome]|uniref:Uncharacterized protein n=1 Tax=marine sediment metagenome TaxID=412755 RepID=A0A0F9R3L4_9ZZZZ
MGMFDEVLCRYPLVGCPEVQECLFQSNDTPAQYLDLYEIREDGTLWHEACDYRYETTDEAPLGFYIHRENKRWEQVLFEGELEIHGGPEDGGEYCFRFWFRDGRVRDFIPSLPDTPQG